MLIKLTDVSNEMVLLDCEQILFTKVLTNPLSDHKNTCIFFKGDSSTVKVKETPEQIYNLINPKKELVKVSWSAPEPRIHDSNAFQVGDYVTVAGTAVDFEGGWDDNWYSDEMDKAVGLNFHIVHNHSSGGFALRLDNNDEFNFPSFVLKKADKE